MKTIELLEDIPEQGLSKGDVFQVDELSAASMIKSQRAKAYDPDNTASEVEELEEVEYGGQKVRTIDDIVDPNAKRMKGVMHVQRLVGPDPGPQRTGTAKTTAEAESTAAAPATAPTAADTPAEAPRKVSGPRAGNHRGASGAEPAGGDAADGGNGS